MVVNARDIKNIFIGYGYGLHGIVFLNSHIAIKAVIEISWKHAILQGTW